MASERDAIQYYLGVPGASTTKLSRYGSRETLHPVDFPLKRLSLLLLSLSPLSLFAG
ncbi:hypothetical protein TRIATDRAFT_160540 [Trichoderma atroviride IMI 206040]|uniref:Uncharacterized protein n=1 Tax=Hypocrea atroviridis (strain ATCC 20476 / IMI 206040) TaxID=452589 RepID=G9NHL4_HYPAI|nr:uncharacterized protein TRIATDRAFT_160540 [Trichoderma atroviride IMI 206040]EHK50106.1 hypothetical protein TRIATDRAFT_160540 [Trichoderma atroviride IMI 206040]